MKYHGNYCGPNWSAGKYQSSVVDWEVPAVDEFDETCRIHDGAYANRADLRAADLEFARANLSLNPKRLGAALLVGAQGLSRSRDINKSKHPTQTNTTNNKMVNIEMVKRDTRPTQNLRRIPPKPARPSAVTARLNPQSRNVPAAYMHKVSLEAPIVGISNGFTTVSHKALLKPLVGTTGYNPFTLACNPGMAQSFPWGSRLARSYDKYRFTKLKYYYRPVCATTQVGVVMMSFDFDTIDSVPATKSEQAETFPNVESNAFVASELSVKCDNLWRFVRQGAISGVDLKTYDLGQFIFSSTYATASLLGELYVEYTVQFDKPSHGQNLQLSFEYSGAAANPFTTSVNVRGAAQPFSVSSSTTLTCLVGGEYCIQRYVAGTVITVLGDPTITSSAGGVAKFTGNMRSVINAAATAGLRCTFMRLAAGDTLNYASVDTATTIIGTTMIITTGDYTNV